MMDIKELAKKLCDESGCHHKCKEIDECVVMEEAEELLINQDKSNNFGVKSNEELFKQALVEGVNRRFDKAIEEAKKIEQIEEMARIINRANGRDDTSDYYLQDATDLYNAGYRKQSEDTVEVVRCKNCVWWEAREYGSTIGRCQNPDNGLISEYSDDNDYCSYGKMKGGAE